MQKMSIEFSLELKIHLEFTVFHFSLDKTFNIARLFNVFWGFFQTKLYYLQNLAKRRNLGIPNNTDT